MAHKGGSRSERDAGLPAHSVSDFEPAKMSASTVHEVGEVYVYIPPELSAAGVELKIMGSVRVVNKVSSARRNLPASYVGIYQPFQTAYIILY